MRPITARDTTSTGEPIVLHHALRLRKFEIDGATSKTKATLTTGQAGHQDRRGQELSRIGSRLLQGRDVVGRFGLTLAVPGPLANDAIHLLLGDFC